MAIYHMSIKVISRGNGSSSVGSSAYRSGEKLVNEHDGQIHDYQRKGGVVYSEIMLPEHAPKNFNDRQILWNSVEQVEKSKNSQLAREFEFALPKELPLDQQIELVQKFTQLLVKAGMCVDFSIHDKGDGNPHAHVMTTMRPLELDGTWGAKSKKEYLLDKNGQKYKTKSGAWASRKINTVDWDKKENLLMWRESWADICNKAFELNKLDLRIDHRSYEEQGIDKIPTIHLGVAAAAMERREESSSDRGKINIEIKKDNVEIAKIDNELKSLWTEKHDIMKPFARNVQDEYVRPAVETREKLVKCEYDYEQNERKYEGLPEGRERNLLTGEQGNLILEKEKCKRDWSKIYRMAKESLEPFKFEIFKGMMESGKRYMKERRDDAYKDIPEGIERRVDKELKNLSDSVEYEQVKNKSHSKQNQHDLER